VQGRNTVDTTGREKKRTVAQSGNISKKKKSGGISKENNEKKNAFLPVGV
jgi:hypothetical protein